MAGNSSESAHLLTERAQREQRIFARDCVVTLGASPALDKGSRDGSSARNSRLRRVRVEDMRAGTRFLDVHGNEEMANG